MFENMRDLRLIFVIISGVLSIILIISSILFVIIYCVAKRDTEYRSQPFIIAILGSLCYLLCILSNMTRYIVLNIESLNTLSVITGSIQLVFWHLGNIFLYIYLLDRLYYGFKETTYSLKKHTLILFWLYIILYFMLISFYCVIGIWRALDPDTQIITKAFIHKAFKIWRYIITPIFIIMDLIASISLASIFVSKLYKISKNVYLGRGNFTSIHVQDFSESKTDDIVSIDELRDDKLFILMSKVTILSFIMLITNQIVLIMSLVCWMYYDNIVKKSYEPIYYIYNILKVFDSFITSLSLFLGFACTNKLYNFICSFCDKKIQLIFVHKMHRSVNNLR